MRVMKWYLLRDYYEERRVIGKLMKYCEIIKYLRANSINKSIEK
jgi:hypothetical protein